MLIVIAMFSEVVAHRCSYPEHSNTESDHGNDICNHVQLNGLREKLQYHGENDQPAKDYHCTANKHQARSVSHVTPDPYTASMRLHDPRVPRTQVASLGHRDP